MAIDISQRQRRMLPLNVLRVLQHAVICQEKRLHFKRMQIIRQYNFCVLCACI